MGLAGTVLLAAIPALISLYAEKYRVQDLKEAFQDDPEDFGLPVSEKFDFVIVGGGTAGCILAARLSKIYSVLLLEAGGTPPPLQSVPLIHHLTREHPDINFVYQSIPQKHASLANEGVITASAGKMLGGSSSHNGMMYEHCHPHVYDRWATYTKDKSWRYQNILRYFKKIEKYVGKLRVSKAQHGYKGPLHIREDTYRPDGDIWLEAGKELGYKISDPNGPQRIGFSPSLFTKRDGRRESTYTGYIKPIEGTRTTLTIYRYSYVSEIIFDKRKTAIGVRYTRHGVARVAFARKEVILSAGAYATPMILIKSGVGPLDQLEKAEVEPVSILPVGRNLMDHPFVNIGPIHVDKPELAFNIQRNMTFSDFDKFIKTGRGPLVGEFQGNVRSMIFSSSSNQDPDKDWPNLMIFYTYFNYEDEPSVVNGAIGVQHLLTTGSVKFNASATGMDDANLPIIDFNYFDDERDFDVTIDGINFLLNVIENTDTFRKVGARYAGQHDKNCKQFKFRSNDYWKCYIRQNIDTTCHASGTCRMGHGKQDPLAVVDSKFRVLGVKKLRVVDASIMPIISNGNTAAPTMMIAEKAATEIIRKYMIQNEKQHKNKKSEHKSSKSKCK